MHWNHQSAEKKNQIAKERKTSRIHRNTLPLWGFTRAQGSWSEGGQEASKSTDPTTEGCLPDPSLNRAVEEQKELILHTWGKTEGPEVLHESMWGQVKSHLLSCCYIERLLTILNISNNVNSERSEYLHLINNDKQGRRIIHLLTLNLFKIGTSEK